MSGGTYTTVASGLTGTSYADTGLVNGTIYYYIVTVVNNGIAGGNSNGASAMPATASDTWAATQGTANWSVGTNWTGGGAPVNGSELTFATSTITNPANDVAGRSAAPARSQWRSPGS